MWHVHYIPHEQLLMSMKHWEKLSGLMDFFPKLMEYVPWSLFYYEPIIWFTVFWYIFKQWTLQHKLFLSPLHHPQSMTCNTSQRFLQSTFHGMSAAGMCILCIVYTVMYMPLAGVSFVDTVLVWQRDCTSTQVKLEVHGAPSLMATVSNDTMTQQQTWNNNMKPVGSTVMWHLEALAVQYFSMVWYRRMKSCLFARE